MRFCNWTVLEWICGIQTSAEWKRDEKNFNQGSKGRKMRKRQSFIRLETYLQQWGGGRSISKLGRKRSAVTRSGTFKQCWHQHNISWMKLTTEQYLSVEDEITTLIVYVMVWVSLSALAQNMRLFLLLLLFLSSRNGSGTPILNPYKSRVILKTRKKSLSF